MGFYGQESNFENGCELVGEVVIFDFVKVEISFHESAVRHGIVKYAEDKVFSELGVIEVEHDRPDTAGWEEAENFL